MQKTDECFGLRALDIEEEKAWRLPGDGMVEFRPDVAVDESERNKKRESEAKRQHDRRCQRAGPVNIANREPQRHAPRVRKSFRASHDQEAAARSKIKAASVAPK